MGANYEQLNCEERTMIQLSLERRCRPSLGVRRWQVVIAHRSPSSVPMT